ncbi:MAG: DUF11 domain-containing protein, partial [Candidatus Lokiarchaeota archaeon]|nr:DUF11 domain-containing protein [Candidatus Lokiarchaeota archaeon]
VTVEDVAPSLTLSGDAHVDEGAIYTLTLSAVSDPGDDTISTCTVDWGDGDSESCLSAIDGTITHTYADGNASHTIAVDLSDEDGDYNDVDTFGVTVNNVAPVAADDEYATLEDTTLTVPADGVLGNDSDVPADTLTAVLDDDVGVGTLALSSGGAFVYTPTQDHNGVVTFTYHASDGAADSNIATVTITVTAVNDPPVADAGGSYGTDEGGVINLDGSASSDTEEAIATYEWDCTADGTYDVTSASPTGDTCGYDDDGTYTVRLRVTDDLGATDTSTATVTVNNVAPTLTLSGDAHVDEGAIYTLHLSAVTDPGDDTISTCTVDWGDGDSDDCRGAIDGTITHTYVDGPAAHTITVDLTDEDGTYTDVDSRSVVVDNVAPIIINVTNTGPVGEGSPVTIDIAATDPGDDLLFYAYDWNEDGDFDDSGEDVDTYTWDDDGVHTITVRVSDDDGDWVTDTTVISVTNTPPVVVAASDEVVNEAEVVEFTGVYTDPGADTHTITWDFGDGVGDVGTLYPTHIYTEPGEFVVTLVITDDDGGVGADTITLTVNNLPPSADVNGPYAGTAGMSVPLTASASYDPGGGALSYRWDLDNDGEYDDANGEFAAYTWTVAGTHTVTVRVADAQGLTDTASAQVFIAPTELDHVVLSPPMSSILSGQAQTYTVEAFDVYGNSRGDVTDQAAFSILESGHGGTWDDNVYTSYAHGDWTVHAVYTGTRVVTHTAHLTVLAPFLHLDKSDDPDPVDAGAHLTYTLAYSNTGNLAAEGVVITDLLDANVSFESADPEPNGGTSDTPVWAIGSLAPGERGAINITVTVGSPLPNGTELVNLAELGTDWLGAEQSVPLSAVEHTTVRSRPVLTITKRDYPDPVTAGHTLRYDLIISNHGNANATTITLTEYYDPHTNVIYTNPPADAGSENRVWTTLPTLVVGEPQTVEVVVQVSSPLPVGAVLTNLVTLESGQTAPVTVTEVTSVASASELTVSKVDSSDPVEAGEEIVYFITYQNGGTAPAEDVVITEAYDSRVNFLSASPAPKYGTTNVWEIGDLGVGDSGVIQVRVEVDTPLTDGTLLTNQVMIDSRYTSPLTDSETTTVSSSPDMAFSVTDQPDPVEAGDPLDYTLHYANVGNADATQVVVTATLDGFVTFDSATPPPTDGSGQVWYWELDTISGEGGSGEIIINVDVTLPLTNGIELDFAAQLDYAEGEPLTAVARTVVSSAPELSLDKENGISVVYAGDWLTYTLTYVNDGNENAYDVIISDTLPPLYIEYSGCDISNSTCSFSGDEVVFDISVIGAQTQGQAFVRVRVDDPLPSEAASIVNHAQMTHPSLGTPVNVQDKDLIGTKPDLTVDATHYPSLFSPGKLMTYTITFGNEGRMHAKNVVIT